MTSSSAGPEADSPSAPRAVVAGHGSFPEGLINAVNQISGCGGVFLAVSNAGLSGADIEERLREASAGIKVFFTDLPGGSATLAVRRLMRTDPGLVLITGANLATLLEASPAAVAERPSQPTRH